MRFDWYQGTVPTAEPEEILGGLLGIYGQGGWASQRPARPRNSYRFAAEVVLGDEVQATVQYGGATGEHGVHVIASGARAPSLARWLRREHPDHRVSRLDVAEDFRGVGVFLQLAGVVEGVATQQGVKTKWIKNSDVRDGDTLYVGAESSTARIVVYEKGKELLSKGYQSVDETMARVELRVRPQKEVKSMAARWSESQCWGYARFTHTVAQALGNVDLERTELREWRASDAERAVSWMLKQYGPLLCARAVELGGFPSLWSSLEETLCGTEQRDASLH